GSVVQCGSFGLGSWRPLEWEAGPPGSGASGLRRIFAVMGSSAARTILETVSKFLRVSSSLQVAWPAGSFCSLSMLLASAWHITQRAWPGRLVRKIGCTLAL